MASETYIAQSPDIASSTLGDDTIIMSTLDSTMIVLNAVGTAIWKSADGLTPVSRVVQETICARFDVAGDQALADANEFVEKLAQQKVLLVSREPFPRKELP